MASPQGIADGVDPVHHYPENPDHLLDEIDHDVLSSLVAFIWRPRGHRDFAATQSGELLGMTENGGYTSLSQPVADCALRRQFRSLHATVLECRVTTRSMDEKYL